MARARVQHELLASAEKVWSLIQDFADMTAWANPDMSISRSEGSGKGAVRWVETAQGQMVERCETYDPASRSFSYSVTDGPEALTHYLATSRCDPTQKMPSGAASSRGAVILSSRAWRKTTPCGCSRACSATDSSRTSPSPSSPARPVRDAVVGDRVSPVRRESRPRMVVHQESVLTIADDDPKQSACDSSVATRGGRRRPDACLGAGPGRATPSPAAGGHRARRGRPRDDSGCSGTRTADDRWHPRRACLRGRACDLGLHPGGTSGRRTRD